MKDLKILKLTPDQKITRGKILQSMADNYWVNYRPWLTKEQAHVSFAQTLEQDPVKLRIINALAASITQEGYHEKTELRRI